MAARRARRIAAPAPPPEVDLDDLIADCQDRQQAFFFVRDVGGMWVGVLASTGTLVAVQPAGSFLLDPTRPAIPTLKSIRANKGIALVVNRGPEGAVVYSVGEAQTELVHPGETILDAYFRAFAAPRATLKDGAFRAQLGKSGVVEVTDGRVSIGSSEGRMHGAFKVDTPTVEQGKAFLLGAMNRHLNRVFGGR